jgi:hypothetical protein
LSAAHLRAAAHRLRNTGLEDSKNLHKIVTCSINFINILQAAFTRADLKSAKKTDSLTVLFTLMEFVLIKAVRKKLLTLTPAGSFSYKLDRL